MVARALRERVRQGFRIVTTNLVIAETFVLILRRVHREPALGFLREVRRPPNLVITSSEDLELHAPSAASAFARGTPPAPTVEAESEPTPANAG